MKIANSSVPVGIKRLKTDTPHETGVGLEVTWSTGETIVYRSDFLRRYCPCADCEENRIRRLVQKEKKGSPLTVIKAGIEEETNLIRVWPVGNYAFGILWGDNHSSGIYTYEHLRELSEIVQLKD